MAKSKQVITLENLSEQDRLVALSFLDAGGLGGNAEERFERAVRATGLPMYLLRQLAAIDSGVEEDPDEKITRLAKSVEGLPFPPDFLLDKKDNEPRFVPVPEMTAWIIKTYIARDGILTHKTHKHLAYAPPAVLWANVENLRGGQRVAGTASMPERAKGDAWAVAQRQRQLLDWFGKVPTFLITLDARLWAEANFRVRLARVEHEMLHCGQAKDSFGCPRFSEKTGLPIYTLRPHDVEVFVLEGERYGVGASAGASMDLFAAWSKTPTVTDLQISQACGNCRR